SLVHVGGQIKGHHLVSCTAWGVRSCPSITDVRHTGKGARILRITIHCRTPTFAFDVREFSSKDINSAWMDLIVGCAIPFIPDVRHDDRNWPHCEPVDR